MSGTCRCVLRGRLVTPARVLPDGVVAVDGARISWVGDAGEWGNDDGWPAAVAVEGTLLPGLVDVHCHGAAGFGFPDADSAGASTAAEHHRTHGTTTLLASLVPPPSRSCSSLWTSAQASSRPAALPAFIWKGRSSHPPGQAPRTPPPSAIPIPGCSTGCSTPAAAMCEPSPTPRSFPARPTSRRTPSTAAWCPASVRPTAMPDSAAALPRQRQHLGRAAATTFSTACRARTRRPGPVAASLAAAAAGRRSSTSSLTECTFPRTRWPRSSTSSDPARSRSSPTRCRQPGWLESIPPRPPRCRGH